MPATLTIRDEQGPGNMVREWELDFDKEWMTVRDLIRERVRREVEAYNAATPEVFQGLVQPEDAERAVNGFKMKKRRRIDWERQFERAIQAFDNNQILVLVDDYQVGTLDESIELAEAEAVTFLRLVPLVGG